ncbi:hypothetical protein ACFXA3_00490 [Streptomyces sp. NPDC059456]|uniref:hypothetical protein n=1 Tax=Streptomyces sp. NPDC059456 TaxID=3346838 RepID=UPI003698A4B3
MTAWDWVVLFGSCALIALVGYCCVRDGAKDDNRQPAARPNSRRQLLADLAAYRALRASGIEQQPGDPYSDDRINAELMFIPHQTRRTEEP